LSSIQVSSGAIDHVTDKPHQTAKAASSPSPATASGAPAKRMLRPNSSAASVPRAITATAICRRLSWGREKAPLAKAA
jgi:hypothetical protein